MRPRAELALLLVGAAPFAAGRLAAAQLGPGGDVRWLCPLRAATGIPCPLCGATRAVVLASRGDAAFLHYNPVWPVVLAALALAGVILLGLRAAGRPLAVPRLPDRAAWTAMTALLAVGWAVALAHRHAIVSA